MMFFDLLRRYVSLIVYPGDREKERKRALSRLIKEISVRGPKWYHPWSNRLTIDFFHHLEELKHTAQRMNSVYRGTVMLAPEAVLPVLERVCDRLLAGQGLSLASLRFESIKDELEAKGAQDDLDAMEALFRKRMDLFNSRVFKAAVEGYRMNLRISALGSFGWDYLTSPFSKRKKNVQAAPVASDLADLLYIISEITVNDDTRSFFHQLREAAAPETYTSGDAYVDLSSLIRLLSGPFEPKGFERVVQATHGDVNFKMRKYGIHDDFRRIIVDALMTDFTAKHRAYVEEMEEQKLNSIKESIFGETPLLPIRGYSNEFSATLARAGLPNLDYILPLSLIKSFNSAIYSRRLRNLIAKAITDLDYYSISFRTVFSDEADALAQVSELLIQFEQDCEREIMGENFRELETGMMDGMMRSRAERTIRSFNTKADELVQSAFQHLTALIELMSTLRDDLRSRSPELISNSGLVNVHKPKIVLGIDETTRILKLFYSLLKLTAVDSGAAQKAVGA